jgi:hypothetical protein
MNELLRILKFAKDDNALVVDHVRVARDECDGGVAGRLHDLDVGWGDDAAFGDDVDVRYRADSSVG